MKIQAATTAFLLSMWVVGGACSSSTSPSDAGADGGSPDGGDAGPPLSCFDYGTAYCDYLSMCQPGTLKRLYGTANICVGFVGGECHAELALPGTGFTQDFLAACSPSLAGMAGACDAGPVPGPVETPTDPCAIVGSGAGGATCGFSGQCMTNSCTLAAGGLCGTCTSPGQLGGGCDLATGVTCPRGMACSSTSSRCVTVVGVGASCDLGVTNACVDGAECVLSSQTATGGTCRALGVAVGVSCNSAGIGAPDCSNAAGVFCDGTAHCAAISYAGPGLMCGSAGAACDTGTCVSASGTCSPLVPSNAPCTLGADVICEEDTTCVAAAGSVTGTCMNLSSTCTSATVSANFTFQPSNISLSAIDQLAGQAVDENVSSACEVTTDATAPDTDCFTSPITAVNQPGGSTVNLVVVRSLQVQAGTVVTVSGGVPLVIISLSDVSWSGQLAANSSGLTIGAGGGAGAGSDSVGNGPGGGLAGSGSAVVGGGGGSYCGLGGAGGGATTTSTAYGSPDIRPLVGGSAGGGGVVGSGAGGGGVQIVAAGVFVLGAGGSITVGGQGGDEGGLSSNQGAGGGGSGGSILLEAQQLTILGQLAANGGGGGGDYGATAGDATDNAMPAAGGAAGSSGGAGGEGGAGATINGTGAGHAATGLNAGGGGGGVGRIRINHSAAGTVDESVVTSPGPSTPCATFGTVRALGSGD